MPRKVIDDLIDQQQGWLDPLGETLSNWIQYAGDSMGSAGGKVFDFLHGVWLGHPLHPVLTDVPVGAWTVAAIMDSADTFFPSPGAKRASDAAVGIGILGGLGAGLAGVVDWHHLKGHERRLGLTHGLLNMAVLTLYGLSWLLRRGKARPAGVSTGMLAFAVASLSAYIGGELVFKQGIGVNRTAFERPPRKFRAVVAETELVENQPHKVMVDGVSVVLVKQGERVYALSNTCTHLGGPLSEGKVEGDHIVCPWHGSRFALEDGSVVGGPATFDEVVYETRVRNGQVEVRPSNQS